MNLSKKSQNLKFPAFPFNVSRFMLVLSMIFKKYFQFQILTLKNYFLNTQFKIVNNILTVKIYKFSLNKWLRY
jgi:hypothetical protein